MAKEECLAPGKFYHIFNCGVNKCNLFNDRSDYEHFISLYGKYIDPVAETYAWVLMPNHFHLLILVRKDIAYKYSMEEKTLDPQHFEDHKWETVKAASSSTSDIIYSKMPVPYLHFSHLFNAYSKYYNKRNFRHGTLFERPYHYNIIDNLTYLRNVLLYIHYNPVNHGFCIHPAEYPWSSYLSLLSFDPTMIQKDKVIGWFDNIGNFKQAHDGKIEISSLKNFTDI